MNISPALIKAYARMGQKGAAAGIGMAALTAAAGAYALSRKKEDLQEHKK